MEKTYHSDMIIGIDPGKSGGICMIHKNLIWSEKCPDNILRMSEILKHMLHSTSPKNVSLFIEKVWARPTDGKSSIFTFGKNYGQWQGIIASNEIEPEYVVPTTWMKHFDVPKAMKKQERKNHIKQLAKSYINKNNFTAYHWKGTPTLATADAIMIAGYGLDKVS
jgi:hypothetical protein|tara:strand:- start:2370 stop:2864 length:495 start_codon:yes stop_codon:yes gene_type:complete